MKYGLDLTLNEIDSDADCAAVVDRFLPGLRDKLGQNPQARGLSLRKLAQYTGGLIPQQALDALDKALQELGRSAGGYTAAERGKSGKAAYNKTGENDSGGRHPPHGTSGKTCRV